MSIQGSDKLLVGRDSSSFQISFDQSGIATSQYVDTGLALKADKTYVDDNFLPLNFNTLPALPSS